MEHSSSSTDDPLPGPSSAISNQLSHMQPVPVPKAKQVFVCSVCGLTEDYDYFGTKPPFCKSIVFFEESYVMQDPFSPRGGNKNNFLLLGSNCALCSKMTCQDCSLFFTRRICSVCSQSHSHLLPEELRRMKKKQSKE